MTLAGPRKVWKYSDAFRVTVVRMSQQPSVQVNTGAAGLDLYPFMLSRWRKEVRVGMICRHLPRRSLAGPSRKLAQVPALERAHAL